MISAWQIQVHTIVGFIIVMLSFASGPIGGLIREHFYGNYWYYHYRIYRRRNC